MTATPDLFNQDDQAAHRHGKTMTERRKAKSAEASYTAKDIEVLEGLEPVRRRPGMYIGGTDERALHHLVAELLDNAMDEVVAGHASWIELELAADGAGYGARQRPRHPGRPAPQVQDQVGAGGHPDDAACRRQVRRQGLRHIRRPARGRHLGGECAVGCVRGRGRARPGAVEGRAIREARPRAS